MIETDNIKEYFSGKRLIGDDFSLLEIEKWYNEESEAYADLGSKDRINYLYEYHNQNIVNGFDYLSGTSHFQNVLGIGSAYGDEFLPIINRIKRLTILEPSMNLRSEKIGSISPVYIKPNVDGSLSFDDNNFDLITCFGVLHHIPNVTFVVDELIRVLTPGGYLLLKEPISSMGDWRFPRKGVTQNERGIPLGIFKNILKKKNIEVISATFIDSLFLHKILNKLFRINFGSKFYVQIDRIISNLLSWNYHYHRLHNYQKIGPGAIFYVVKKC